jgi:hypothetical protein
MIAFTAGTRKPRWRRLESLQRAAAKSRTAASETNAVSIAAA